MRFVKGVRQNNTRTAVYRRRGANGKPSIGILRLNYRAADGFTGMRESGFCKNAHGSNKAPFSARLCA